MTCATEPINPKRSQSPEMGINLSAMVPKKKRGDLQNQEFVPASILYSITLPAHENAHYVGKYFISLF